VTTRGAACHKNDHAGALLQHVSGRGTRRNELGTNQGLQRNHVFVDCKIDGGRTIAIVTHSRAHGIEDQVDVAGFPGNASDVVLDRQFILDVHDGSVSLSARGHDLVNEDIELDLGASANKHFGAACRKLPGDSATDGTPPASTTAHFPERFAMISSPMLPEAEIALHSAEKRRVERQIADIVFPISGKFSDLHQRPQL
jgi:hypothetical protein